MTENLPSVLVGDVDDLDDPFLLDVRESDEYEAGHAPAAVFHPLATIPEVWSTLPADRTILCICRVGGRSAQATAFLLERGLDARNLEGGMQAWERFGLDVVRADGSFGTVI